MARQRYTTTSPNFSNDFMYQAPWELAMKSLEFNEKQVDNVFDQAQLIENSTMNVNFLEADRGNLDAEKQKYESQIGEITNALREDPTQWKKQMPKIKKVGQELQANMRTGNIGKIQGSYQAYQSLLKSYEDLAKKEPHTVQEMAQKYLSDWKKRSPKGSLDGVFSGGPIFESKSLTDKEFVDIIKDFKPEEFTTLNGLYKIDNKIVSKDQVAMSAINLAVSNPEMANFIRQRQSLGDASYINPIFKTVDTTTGKVLDEADVISRQQSFSNRAREIADIFNDPVKSSKYSPEQLQKLQGELIPTFSTQLNPENAIAQQALALGNVYSFSSQKTTGNEPAIVQYKEGQSNARQAQSIAATNARQANAQQHEKDMLDKRQGYEQDNIKLKASLAPEKGTTTKGTTKGGTKASEALPDVTTSGVTTFPSWGTSIADDMDIIKGGMINGSPVSNYNKMISNTKTLTLTDAATSSALSGTKYAKDKDVIGIVDFISKELRSGNKEIANLVSDKDDKGLAEAYFAKQNPNEAGNRKGMLNNLIGATGSVFTQVRDNFSREYDAYNQAEGQFENLHSKVKGALTKYTESYNNRNDLLREPKAQAEYFGINTKNPATRKLQDDINVNIGEFDFYKTDDLMNKLDSVSEIKLSGISDSFGGVPVSIMGKDSKGNTIKGVPKPGMMPTVLQYISNNSSKIFSSADTLKTNLYFGNGGKNATLASAFDYVASAGDKKQIVEIPTSAAGKSFKITKEAIGKDSLDIKVQLPGMETVKWRMKVNNSDGNSQGMVSNSNINNALIQLLDKISRENNIRYYVD